VRERLRAALKSIPGLSRAYRGLKARCGRLRRPHSRARGQGTVVWSEAPEERTYGQCVREWLSSPQVLNDYVFPQLGGRNWCSYVGDRCRPIPRERCLSLACGDGSLERNLARMGICLAYEGLDFSPEAIALCREAAEREGLATLTYRVADLETIRLARASCDLVIGWMGLHHIEGLSRLFGEVARSLRAGGLFVFNEYVGPARFQLPSHQVELIDEWLRKLPEELRRSGAGPIRDSFRPPTVAEVVASAPSEAVSSDQILPLVKRNFMVREQVDYGGALLHWVLHDITHKFDPENQEHRAWLSRLYAAERDLMDRGILASDFSLVIAEKAG
jgi:SAM-dependent methyltransferase